MRGETNHGDPDGTYVQFYPALRERLQQAGGPADSTADEARVVEAVRTMFASMAIGDMDRYREVTAPDFYAFDMGKRMTSDELLAFVRSARESGMSFNWRVTEPQVRLDGRMAGIR